jgi:hypothetical protein
MIEEYNRKIQEPKELKTIHLGQYQRPINEISVNMELVNGLCQI